MAMYYAMPGVNCLITLNSSFDCLLPHNFRVFFNFLGNCAP
jgi:hypothetical protein